ncbi:MAG: YceI family protein [Saprospiraceae bacterium]|nr:YceI family protein [Saprospiraceae bacterium]
MATSVEKATKTLWSLDPTHSELSFKVKHLMITNVTGQFNVIQAKVEASDSSFNDAQVSFTADVNSINTSNEQRDAHLKGADFFEAEKYPNIAFVSTDYQADSGKISGELTIKGITKSVSLDVEFSGINKDPWGNEKAGFSITGKINRTDWGLTWNAALETGGVLVSEDVRISAEVQFVKQAA